MSVRTCRIEVPGYPRPTPFPTRPLPYGVGDQERPEIGATVAKKPHQRLTSEQMDKSLANERLKIIVFMIFSAGSALSLVVLAATPLAKAIAGKTTNFNFSISVAVNIALALSTAVGGAGCYELNRRRRHHYKRAKELEQRLTERQAPKPGA